MEPFVQVLFGRILGFYNFITVRLLLLLQKIIVEITYSCTKNCLSVHGYSLFQNDQECCQISKAL